MQMQAQQQLIQTAKEEAAEKAAAAKEAAGDKVNVLDIKVEENFDIDDI